jgi:hypothetical protein
MNLKRFLWLGAIVLILGYFFYSSFQNRAKEDTREVQKQREIEATKAALDDLVARTNADDKWKQALHKGKGAWTGKILTIELEQLWLQKRPILFIGAIYDITTRNKREYIIHLGSETDLRLELSCPKEKIDNFLKSNASLKPDTYLNFVTFVAIINKIRTEYLAAEDGSRLQARVGVGECVDVGPVINILDHNFAFNWAR